MLKKIVRAKKKQRFATPEIHFSTQLKSSSKIMKKNYLQAMHSKRRQRLKQHSKS
jgi:hypothetical protein